MKLKKVPDNPPGQSGPSLARSAAGSQHQERESVSEVQSDIYGYEPLDRGKRQIRLVRLLSLHEQLEERPIPVLEMRTVDIDDKDPPSYLALSYVWGPGPPSCAITVDGRNFFIRTNLYDFLCSFARLPDNQNQPLLWIDQLCINQEDFPERNQQVQLMSQIYRRCESLIMWLGLSVYGDVYEFSTKTHKLDFVHRFLEFTYFSRLWVVQEVMLAKKAQILCGDVWVDWHEIRKLMFTQWSSLPRARFLFLLSKETDDLGPDFHLSLYECISRFYELGCENPRDRVYGFLGLLQQDESFQVGYAKPVYEVYLDALKWIFQETASHCCKYGRVSEGPATWYWVWPQVFVELASSMGLDAKAIQHIQTVVDEVLDRPVITHDSSSSDDTNDGYRLISCTSLTMGRTTITTTSTSSLRPCECRMQEQVENANGEQWWVEYEGTRVYYHPLLGVLRHHIIICPRTREIANREVQDLPLPSSLNQSC